MNDIIRGGEWADWLSAEETHPLEPAPFHLELLGLVDDHYFKESFYNNTILLKTDYANAIR